MDGGRPRAGDAAPLIVTLLLDDDSQEQLNALRRRHFPVERNHLDAHVTMFHQLPGAELAAVCGELAHVSRRARFDVTVSGLRFLGRGVAYTLSSPALAAMRAELASAWAPWLTPQDRQPYAPHVTVQNKVTPERARILHADLAASFTPYVIQAVGLAAWHYEGGPWRPASLHPFDG